jgi:hypothetical protein
MVFVVIKSTIPPTNCTLIRRLVGRRDSLDTVETTGIISRAGNHTPVAKPAFM